MRQHYFDPYLVTDEIHSRERTYTSVHGYLRCLLLIIPGLSSVVGYDTDSF